MKYRSKEKACFVPRRYIQLGRSHSKFAAGFRPKYFNQS